ncbi:MAG TPA: helix-turn-helix domain-containing protein [Thermoleophilia bacterium]|nr:helix-turn-helix domain-containing protein [Thermoleophilia bacterium]
MVVNAWTDREAAHFLGVGLQTLRNWRVRGYGPPFVKAGRAVRYRPDDVRDWQEQQIRHSTSDPGPVA